MYYLLVFPAEAGNQELINWMPVCTGMTERVMDAGLHRHDKERE